MNVVVNGEARSLPAETTVLALLETEELNRPGVAVAINREIVRRGEWTDREIREGDRIEIIHAVQGG